MTPAEFIAAIGPAAKISASKTGIPASFTVAEAAVETGWGGHVPGMNLFGVKADSSWHGPITVRRTHEVLHGEPVTIEAKFRAYTDWLGSIEDHAQFLQDNPRYKAAFVCKTGADFAHAIAAAGYATDPDYGNKIAGIIHAHGLDALDA